LDSFLPKIDERITHADGADGETHWEILAATDFFTVDVWTGRGLTRFAVQFVIELSTRRVGSTMPSWASLPRPQISIARSSKGERS